MLWDADSSYSTFNSFLKQGSDHSLTANDRFDLTIKTAIRKDGVQTTVAVSSVKATSLSETSSKTSKASTTSAVQETSSHWRDPKATARVHFPSPQLGTPPL